MPRMHALVGVIALWIGLVAADLPRTGRTVDLNAPGALQTLEQSHPAHFDKVRKILRGVLQRPDVDVPRWMQVSFGARDVVPLK